MFKTTAIAVAAIAASATIASADVSYLSSFAMDQERSGQIELGTVRAANDGVVEVYSFHRGVQGDLLGSTNVNAGANADVDVKIARPATDAIAVLKVNGQIVDTQEIEFN